MYEPGFCLGTGLLGLALVCYLVWLAQRQEDREEDSNR